jgi:hypothetical protein
VQAKAVQQQFGEELAGLSARVVELTGQLQQRKQQVARQQADVARLQRQLGLSRMVQEPRLSAQQVAALLGPEADPEGAEYQQLVAALVRRTEELQVGRAALHCAALAWLAPPGLGLGLGLRCAAGALAPPAWGQGCEQGCGNATAQLAGCMRAVA